MPNTDAVASRRSGPAVHDGFLASLERRVIDDRVQAFRRFGPRDGRPLVLLHGLMDNSAGFAPLLAALEADAPLEHDVIAPDWRGHGDSDATPGAYWFPNYLADLEALLDTLGVTEPAVLVGHSMGGQVASLYAGARPDRVAGLVTLDSLNVPDSDAADAPARYRDWLDTLAHGAAAAERVYDSIDAFAGRLARRYPELDAATRYYLAESWLRPIADGRWQLRADPAHRRRMPYGFRADEAAALWREVRCPVLCIDGGRSPATSFVSAETLAARRACFARIGHRTLAGCGHMLHLQDAPAVAAELRSFVRRLDADR
ncbi:alpha/beta fold hydrolase [Salinisphaera hydrothermalis]|uniref:alpha/beta fold hydrolase n=1 Tax=Salinisphaera hydrothermalis TaxID=563188 RepID=UPI0018DD741D|nr:alpha/beta hydrolase [Salinisphaera hydrothermalis]